MGIKHHLVSLTCELGSDELSVQRVDDDEIVFTHTLGDQTNTVYVTDADARQFAEAILDAVNKSRIPSEI